MQVACGQDLRDGARCRPPQEPEALGIHRRDSVLKLGGVIPVVVLNIQPALDDRVSHDHADHVSAGAEQGSGRVPEPIEPAQPLERPGHETDNARPLGHETTGQRSPGRPPIAGRHRPGRPW